MAAFHSLIFDLQDGKTHLWKYGRIHQDIEVQVRHETPNETCVACRSFPHNKVRCTRWVFGFLY